MRWQWLPWRFLIRRASRTHGIMDPAMLLARIRRFAEPSEVNEPLELVHSWVIFHARGIINTRAIQHNLDWIWPYWIERQFNPRDPAFVPRSYSITHVNLTHRNWTAVGQPEFSLYPLVDPRGLVTPLHDGWSLDFWLIDRHQGHLIPSKLTTLHQKLLFHPALTVATRAVQNGQMLSSFVHLDLQDQQPLLMIDINARASGDAHLVVGLRPYNSEGIQFIDHIQVLPENAGWRVNDRTEIFFNRAPDKYLANNYHQGDVFNQLPDGPEILTMECPVGMATAAAIFPFLPSRQQRLRITIPLEKELKPKGQTDITIPWSTALAPMARLKIPEPRMQRLYQAAVHTLILLSADEVVPGPAVYRRFWFRDACLMLNALLTLGHHQRCLRHLVTFPQRQRSDGFFHSQEGEWDSNGQVLWLCHRYTQLSSQTLPEPLIKSLAAGASWLIHKRRHQRPHQKYPGLLPAGFSAEHFGPNNYYYWDNFWGLAGLMAAQQLFQSRDPGFGRQLAETIDDYRETIFSSIAAIPDQRSQGGIPAAPERRMDGGAVGSIVADYPLQLLEPGNARIMSTVKFLLERCLLHDGFFHDMTHSGINAYLTLHLAQVLMRAGDGRWQPLVRAISKFASATGHWPEAIHPANGGGCMGDGQHGWAATEWVLWVRNAFVREERDRLVVGSGLLPEWLNSDKPLFFGPTLTPWGKISVTVEGIAGQRHIQINAQWRETVPKVIIQCPGYHSFELVKFDLIHPLTKE